MAIVPAGTPIYSRATGDRVGCITRNLVIDIRVDATQLIESLDAARASLDLTIEAVRAINRALRAGDRLTTLRYQARRKGRPGWRSIRIPPRPRWQATFTPNEE